MAEEGVRRRTSFEKDLREFFLKIGFAGLLAVGFEIYGMGSWLASIGLGLLISFAIAAGIRGSGHFAD